MSVGSRSQQRADKNRPYWVHIAQGGLNGGGAFGGNGGFVLYNQGGPGPEINLINQPPTTGYECIRCGGGDQPPIIRESNENNPLPPIPNNTPNPPAVTAFQPAGLPGETGAIVSFYPPITVDIDCQQSPLRIEGGQEFVLYDLEISARGLIRDFYTNEVLTSFNVNTTVRGPGPITGYTVTQYTWGVNTRDLRANVYYRTADNQLADFKKNFNLSLSTITGNSPDLTLEGNNYFFDVEEVTLDNLVRADGANDQCGNSACEVDVEFTYEWTDNPGVIITQTVNAPSLPFTVNRVALSGPPLSVGQSVIVYSEGDVESQVIFIANTGGGPLPGQVLLTAALTSINCTYDVNGQLPGCFIETPETCNVTIRDQAGILLDQTYFGRPEVTVSDQYPPELIG